MGGHFTMMIWIARTTISGTPTADDDSFKIQIRGDSD